MSQLVLAALVVHLYGIESTTFLRVFILATAGFAINVVLPLRYRLLFFVLLSFAGVFLVFQITDGTWLIASGLMLIAICHLPVPFTARVVTLVAVGGLLALSRAGIVASLWSSAVWPILGAMFMFRLALYVLAVGKVQSDRGPLWALAYFFMLPNMVFPLFPVVDYQTFRRTYYDRSDAAIYEQGLQWISRGLVHLLLYRFVYHQVLTDPSDVVRLSDLVQFMLGTLLLYLRVSGQFHLIVGLLHLFGFRLPETNRMYFLAPSFTELWRRINIYWTDFMMKVVFYPAYFRLKRLGPTRAIGSATAVVFATTWFLHSYQWFWLRGDFPVSIQDVLFWGTLGGMVVLGALRESKAGKKPIQRAGGWSWRFGLSAVATFSLFCFLWSLWSADSIGRWIWMLGAAAEVDVRGVVLLASALGTVLVLGGIDWRTVRSAQPRWLEFASLPSTRTFAVLLVLLAATLPAVQTMAPSPVAAGLASLRASGLNARDTALQHRGYYERLDVRTQPAALGQNADGRDGGWADLSTTGVLRERRDLLTRDLLPSRRVVWNGHTFSTNRWGMRDDDYTLEKPPDTLRIALLGPSHVMGNGVSDGQTFEALVETRLNREFRAGRYRRVEILNFGVDGYSLSQQVAILEDRVLDFSPDIVIATHYQSNRSMTERYLLKLLSRGIPVPKEPLGALFASAGLADMDGSVAVPFAAGRRLAKRLGLQPRMPSDEAEARIRRISESVVGGSLRRFAEVTRSRGMVPVVLGLNTVIDNVARDIPNRDVIEQTGLPVISLFDVFPEMDRPALRASLGDDHPNAAGHRLIADRLYRELTAFLEADAAGRALPNATIISTDRRF